MNLPKFCRLKALLVSDDHGANWLCVRQFYMTGAENFFLEKSLQGKKFKIIEDQDNGKTKETEG